MSTTTVFFSLMTGLSAVCVLLLIASCLSVPSLEFIGIQQPLKKFLNRYILTYHASNADFCEMQGIVGVSLSVYKCTKSVSACM